MASTVSNLNKIPAALKARKQWVLWRYDDTRNGKRTKKPRQVNGALAKVNDASTWCEFDDLFQAQDSNDGFGYVFAEGDGLVGIDLDHCIEPLSGDIEPWAEHIAKQFPGTYKELSPSGTGLHIICRGKCLATGARKWKDASGQEVGFEIYDYRSPRYFTVTGNTLDDGQPTYCQEGLEYLYEAYFGEPEPYIKGQDAKQYDEEALLDALHSIQADDYQTWIKVGMALKSGGYGYELWDSWSMNSPKYQPGVCYKKWNSFRGQGVGLGSIFHISGKRYVFAQAPNKSNSGPNIPSEAPNNQEDDFRVREWPTLHDDALMGLVGRIVRASVESSEADPAAVLATLLVRAGATFGRHAWTKIGDDRHYPLVFGMVVGASANARKGTSLGPVERIFEDAESRLGAPELRVTNGLSSGEGLIAAIRDAKKATKDEDEDEGVNDKRLLVIESEFAGPLKAMQRQGNTLSVVIRDAWDRRKLSIMTKNSPLTASDGHIAMLGHITKHELTRLLEKVEMSNGLVNRFLWFCSRRSKILAFPEGLSEEVIPGLAHDLAAAIRHGQRDQLMNFDTDAAEYYRALYFRVTTQEAGGIVGDITARGPAQIRRLALIYALLECDNMIRIEHLRAAEAVWNYCLASSKWIFGSPTTGANSPAESLNERIMQVLKSGEKSQSELSRLFKNTTKAGQLATALSELQAIGRISQDRGSSTGGRAPIVWRLVEVR